MKVVEKFTESLATEIGNFVLKSLPKGGIYLVGEIAALLEEYLLT